MPHGTSHRYRPFLELGRGRISRVYLAESLGSSVRKLAALKLLNPELRGDSGARARFQREATLSAYLNHPNTVYVFEVGEHDDNPMIVMEYLEGVPLAPILSCCGDRVSLALRLHVLTQVLGGLHHLHELRDFEGNALRAVHRDVSPHNVLLLHEGGVKIVGFGSAQANLAGAGEELLANKPSQGPYCAPERVFADADTDIDRRADIYAVGVMLWEVMADRPMWAGLSWTSVERALERGELPRIAEAAPDAPRELQRVAMRALARDPGERYASAHTMLVELERAARDTVGIGQSWELAELMEECFGGERDARRQLIGHAMYQALAASSLPDAANAVEYVSESSRRPAARITLRAGRRRWSGNSVRLGLALVLLAGVALWARLATQAGTSPAHARGAPRRDQGVAAARSAPERVASADSRTAVRKLVSDSREREPVEREAKPTGPSAKVETDASPTRLPAAQDGAPDAQPTPIAPAVNERVDQVAAATQPGLRANGSVARVASVPGSRTFGEPNDDGAQRGLLSRSPRSDPKTASAPANACRPPFRLTADGVKAFKPECF